VLHTIPYILQKFVLFVLCIVYCQHGHFDHVIRQNKVLCQVSYLSSMGWQQLVGSLKLQVSFAEYSLFCRALLQKRPIILRSLLTEATPYLIDAKRTELWRITIVIICYISDFFSSVCYVLSSEPKYVTTSHMVPEISRSEEWVCVFKVTDFS